VKGTADEVSTLQAQIKALTEKRSGLASSSGNDSQPTTAEPETPPTSPLTPSTSKDAGVNEELKRLKYLLMS
jgi:hypothetical protein